MEIHPERSSGSVTNNIPNQQTAELTTNVMVPDGATLVIGGLMEDEDDYAIQGLPGLARLPALGFLFGFRQKNEGRRELVVLLTPHIWTPDVGMAYKVDSNLDVNDPDAGPTAEGGSKSDGSASPVPAIAPLPAGASSGGPPSIGNAEVALVAGTPTQAAPSSAGAAPAARTALPDGTPPDQRAADSRPPRKGVLSSFWQRVTGRSDTTRRQEPRPSTTPTSASEPTAPPQTAVPVAQANPAAMPRRAVNHQDDRVVRTSAELPATTTALPPVASSRSVAGGSRRHTTSEGETFASISQSYYGSTRYDTALWWINRRQVNWPNQLAAGDRLVIPSAREIKSTLDQIGDARSTGPGARPTAPSESESGPDTEICSSSAAGCDPQAGTSRRPSRARPLCRVSTGIARWRLGARSTRPRRAAAVRLGARAAVAIGAEPPERSAAGRDERPEASLSGTSRKLNGITAPFVSRTMPEARLNMLHW